jgi:hypothetical protein
MTYLLIAIPLLAALAWLEWGKVKCSDCNGVKKVKRFSPFCNWYHAIIDCPVCHGSGRVRRSGISKHWRKG